MSKRSHFPFGESLTIPEIAKLAGGWDRRTMLNYANRGEIPAEIVNPGKTTRRYANTPQLCQWCTEMYINRQLRQRMARRVSPNSAGAVGFAKRLHRIKTDYQRMIERRPLKTWRLSDLNQLFDCLEYLEIMRQQVKTYIDYKRRREK